MKIIISLLALVLTLTLSFETLASGENHKAATEEGHRNNSALFPQPQPNLALSKAPAAPELLEPAFHAKFKATSTLLKWKEVEGANAYHFQVATDPNFKWLVAEQNLYTKTTYDLTGIEPGKHYFWRVAALKTGNKATHMKSPFKMSAFISE